MKNFVGDSLERGPAEPPGGMGKAKQQTKKGKEMKNIFITATIATAIIGNAFGAASLRTATKTISGAANQNVASPARAGTLHATKTISSAPVSAPIITTDESIAQPIATNTTTDARMSFLSKSKNKPNIGKIKDTAAAQQELNNLSSQIEELQSQLSDARAEQSTVLKISDIDDKITTNVTSKTYTKEEIDSLLAEKLPKIDANGNLNITDSTGTTIAQILPYSLYATHKYNGLANTQTYKLMMPHDFKTSSFGGLAQEYTRGWVSDICAAEQSNPDLVACGFYNADGKSTAMTEFSTISCFKGMHKISTSVDDDLVSTQYTTFEDVNETQIRERFCGDAQSDVCSISGYTKTTMGACAEKTFTLTESVERAMVHGGSGSGTVFITCPEGCHVDCEYGNGMGACWCLNSNGEDCGEASVTVTPAPPEE